MIKKITLTEFIHDTAIKIIKDLQLVYDYKDVEVISKHLHKVYQEGLDMSFEMLKERM